MKLVHKMTIVSTLQALVIVLLMGTLAYHQGQQTIEDNVREHLETITLLKVMNFRNWVSSNQQAIGRMAQRPLLQDLVKILVDSDPNAPKFDSTYSSILSQHLRPLSGDTLGFKELSVLHPITGEILVSSDERQVGKYRDDMDYFLEGRMSTYFQTPYYSLTHQEQLITIAIPFIEDSDVVGILAGHLNLDVADEIMKQGLDQHMTGDTFTVNTFNFFVTDGRFADAPDYSRAVHSDGINQCIEGQSGTQIYTNHHDDKVISAFQWLPDLDLCVLTELNESEAFAPIVDLQNNMFILGIVVLSIGSSVAVFFSSTITQPLQALLEGIRVIQNGNLNHSIAIDTQDELGDVSRAFNEMVSNLQEITVSKKYLEDEIERRKQVEMELENRGHVLALSLQAAHAGVWIWDIELNHITWDAQMEHIHGLAVGTFGGTYEDWKAGLHPDDLEMTQLAIQDALADIKPFDVEFRIVRPDSSVRYVLGQAIVIRDPETNELIQMVGVNIDTTERKQTERALQEMGHRLIERVKELRAIYDIAQYGDEAPSIEQYLERVTRRIPASMQYPDLCETAITVDEKIYGDASILQSPYRLSENINIGEQVVGNIVIGYTEDVEYLTEEEEHISAIADQVGNYLQRQQLFEQLQQSLVDLKRSNQELEQFAYVASHDLQEPLRMVTSYLQLFKKRYANTIDDKADQYIYYAVDGATRMKSLINDLLSFSRVMSRGSEFVVTDLNEVVSLVLHDLNLLIKETGAIITYDALPTVMADSSQLCQVFLNLVSNAIKFRGDNTPQIHIGATQHDNMHQIYVKDNGIGISSDYYEKIFVIFQRLHTREEYEGTGIGLAVCKRIIERHDGSMWVESEPGHGSCFYFTLPINSEVERS